jgi:hypothetical protein
MATMINHVKSSDRFTPKRQMIWDKHYKWIMLEQNLVNTRLDIMNTKPRTEAKAIIKQYELDKYLFMIHNRDRADETYNKIVSVIEDVNNFLTSKL